MDNAKEVRFHLRFSQTKIQRRAAEILQTECGPREKTDFIAHAILAYVGELPIRGQTIVTGGESQSNQQALLQQTFLLQQVLLQLQQLQTPDTDQMKRLFSTFASYFRSNEPNTQSKNINLTKKEIQSSAPEEKYSISDADTERNVKQTEMENPAPNKEYIRTDTGTDMQDEKVHNRQEKTGLQENDFTSFSYEDSFEELNDESIDAIKEGLNYLTQSMELFQREKNR